MSQQPRPESRISSLEKRATTIEAAIEELSSDQAEELKVIRREIKQLDDGMMGSFKKIGDTIIDTLATKDDISRLETRLDRIEATMATKDDLTAMQGEIKQDTGTLETRLDRIEATQEQILKLLQQKTSE